MKREKEKTEKDYQKYIRDEMNWVEIDRNSENTIRTMQIMYRGRSAFRTDILKDCVWRKKNWYRKTSSGTDIRMDQRQFIDWLRMIDMEGGRR